MNRYPREIQDSIEDLDWVITRFPPEPNGKLHIGHVKAIEADFGLRDEALKMGKKARCYLRFDDTNPVNEKEDYVKGIIEDLEWLGHKPDKITYSSDYFDQLYGFAEQLIVQGDAYICELSPEMISRYRKTKKPSPFRNRSMPENLRLFREMKNGKHVENTYCLRMKGDLEDPDSCMWDLVFYRIIHVDHHRTGDKWCIYPTYDFAHCLVDSMEGVTHSLCSTEFISRRKSYFWLLDRLGMPKPFVYEFGKLGVSRTILSKRKMKELVEKKIVDGWDDPRMMTLCGLRRRGYVPEALRRFCLENGLTRVDAVLEYEKLEQCLRIVLDYTAPRRFVVMEPLKVVFESKLNYGIFAEEDPSLAQYDEATLYDYPIHMKDLKAGKLENVDPSRRKTRTMDITKTIYIERSSFRLQDDKKFYGLAPKKIVRLKYSGFIQCVGYEMDGDTVTCVRVKPVIPEKPKKVKGILNWVSEYHHRVMMRFCKPLLTEEGEIDPKSTHEIEAKLEHNFCDSGDEEEAMRTVQFERCGYWHLDEKSVDADKPVFIQTVTQKASY